MFEQNDLDVAMPDISSMKRHKPEDVDRNSDKDMDHLNLGLDRMDHDEDYEADGLVGTISPAPATPPASPPKTLLNRELLSNKNISDANTPSTFVPSNNTNNKLLPETNLLPENNIIINSNNGYHHQQELQHKKPPSPPAPPPPAAPLSVAAPPPKVVLHNPNNIKSCIVDQQSGSQIGLISAEVLAHAIDNHYSTPLPEVDEVFPWLHGLHPGNLSQLGFLNPQTRQMFRHGYDPAILHHDADDPIFRLPQSIRGLMVVKVCGFEEAALDRGEEDEYDEDDLGSLVGTVSPQELLCTAGRDHHAEDELDNSSSGSSTASSSMNIDNNGNNNNNSSSSSKANSKTSSEEFEFFKETSKKHLGPKGPSELLPKFLELDPEHGISLRNFQIQVAKWGCMSDIILYAPNYHDPKCNSKQLVGDMAKLFAQAQHNFKTSKAPGLVGDYRTFIVDDGIDEILQVAPHIVAVPPRSMNYDEDELRLKNWDSNFLFHERVEMSMMSSASPIGHSVGSGDLGTVWLGNTVDFETYVELYQRSGRANNNSNSSSSSGTTSECAGNGYSNDNGNSNNRIASTTNEAHSDGDTGVSNSSDALRTRNWATFIECFDGAQLPTVESLEEYIQEAEALLQNKKHHDDHGRKRTRSLTPLTIQFPASGTISIAHCQDEDFCAIASLCKLIYLRSQVEYRGSRAGVLIYCNDGYSETSLLSLLYVMYSTGVCASQAWVDLHVKYSRPFFCFRRDVVVLLALEKIIHKYSPAIESSKYNDTKGGIKVESDTTIPAAAAVAMEDNFNAADHIKEVRDIEVDQYWFARSDGSSPSRILPHMYLGSLIHAENLELLVKLGIKRVLSVGESLQWLDLQNQDCDQQTFSPGVTVDKPCSGITKAMYIGDIEDDGVDALMSALTSCLDFLDEGYRLDEPTLVHCRVGVSRSATVCIAEVMKRLGVGLPRAYLFVRVRRLNVIIQPNLRFMFELVKWEEMHRRNGEGWLREVDWHILCREIAIINKAYIS